jgi:pyruvate, orthophosphate dikinase
MTDNEAREGNEMAHKYVYAFGEGDAEGRGDQKALLGGKGAGLAEMSRLGIPVPPGFTVTTEVCTHFHANGGAYPEGLWEEFDAQLRRLEERLGRRFGGGEDPLLVSVRSGAAVSMPGMMDTVLNIGLTSANVAAQIAAGTDARFVRDSYRRLLSMYGDVVLGAPHEAFEKALAAARERHGAATDAELSAAALAEVIAAYEEILAAHGKPFPQKPGEQLRGAVAAVFHSWNIRRARDYRKIHGIPDDMGTAVNVQAMVFGNRGADCATGVAFTRSPATGERKLYGEYLINAQGEDVVAGIRTPHAIAPGAGAPGLAGEFPAAFRRFEEVCGVLEDHYHDMLDVEFTIEHDRLYMLQTRVGKRTGPAAVRIAVEMVAEGRIDEATALGRVEPEQLEQMLAPVFDRREKEAAVAGGRLLARGLGAGPGAASGRIALTADRAAEMAAAGPVLLVREETSPDDIVGMHAAVGILTSRGGMTSHAAVVARGMGKPCIVGAGALTVDSAAGEVRVDGKVFREGEELSIDGTSGEVLAGALKAQPSEILEAMLEGGAEVSPAGGAFLRLLAWADGARRLGVRANADTPHDARVARAFGAQGIGLCRTEHMFFEEDRIPWVQRMILAATPEDRRAALEHLLPLQQGDFEGIFEAMDSLPVTVRLLDPPLHEFLPREPEDLAALAKDIGVDVAAVRDKVDSLHEANPMLGHRGCRLGLTAPEIYDMQVEAIMRAACARRRAGGDVRPEIMLPLVGSEAEIARLRQRTAAVVERVMAEQGVRVPVLIGTMIEVPRAALVADQIARHADFFSFGTNDLTQMTFGFSRDDVGSFLPRYLEEGILPFDPFARLDAEGVGQLVTMACEKGRATRADLKLGICGEHGGEPHSVAFFHRAGLDYVSCSPYRVPVARLAAAKAAMGHGGLAADV